VIGGQWSVNGKARAMRGPFRCEPDMVGDLEVKVLSELDRRDRSEPQGVDREVKAG